MIKTNCANLEVRPNGHGDSEYTCRIKILKAGRDCHICLSYKDKYANLNSASIIKQMREVPMKP